ESFARGSGAPISMSAHHAERLAARLGAPLPFADRLAAAARPPEAPDADAERRIQLAIVGRPNVGKSTLVNRLLGEERLLTGPEPGITRDAIAVELDWHGQGFRFHDTAGMRRRARIADRKSVV